MARVTNKFYIQSIHDGSSIYAELVSTKQLVQTISDKGTVNPDWTVAANQPTLYPRTKLSGQYKGCSGSWYYNDKVLTEVTVEDVVYYHFDGDGVSGNNYYFQKTTVTEGGVTWPAVKIIRNLAGVNNNYDNDLIRFDGSVEEGGAGIDFSVSRAIRITRYTGTGNYGQVLGGTAITEAIPTTVVYAQLYDSNTGAAIDTSTYKTVWYREGIDAKGSPHWTSGTPGTGQKAVSNYTNGTQPSAAVTAGVELPENCQWITVGTSDIDDKSVLRCEFFGPSDDIATATPLFVAFGTVDDETDDFQMQIRCDSSSYIGQDTIQLKSGQAADMKAWMSKNTDPTVEYGGFNAFYCKLYDNHNNLILEGGTNSTSPFINDQTSPLYNKTVEKDSSDQMYGFFDVTQSTMPVYSDVAHTSTIITVSKGGKLTISFDYVDRPNDTTKKGGDGGITGWFLALDEEEV